MLLATEKEVCILRNMFCEIKSIVFKIKVCFLFQYLSNIVNLTDIGFDPHSSKDQKYIK